MSKSILASLIIFSLFSLPFFALSAENLEDPPNPDILGENGVLAKVRNVLFTALLIVVAIFFVAAGYQLVTAAGDPQKFEKARQSVIYGIIGLVIALAARGIVRLIKETIGGA